MAWAFVQGAGNINDAASTTVTVTFGSNVTAGNTIVVGGGGVGYDLSGVTDSLGNTYSGPTNNIYDAAVDTHTGMWYAENITGGACTVTLTFTNAGVTYKRMAVAEYSGLKTSASFDVSAGQNVASTGTGTDGLSSGNTATSAEANELAVTFAHGTNAAATFSAGTNYTRRVNGGTNAYAIGDRNCASTAAYAGLWTSDTDVRANALVALFKQVAGGAPSGNPWYYYAQQ